MDEQQGAEAGGLGELSDRLAGAVEQAGGSVVRVEARRRQAASGVIWAHGGLVLTADHVLERDEDLLVGLPDGRSVGAAIVGRDPSTDLALLRVEAEALSPIARGPVPRLGHLALVVARPGAGLETSIGVVSALGGPARTRRGGRLEGFIRTDATMYPGFSGGPLVDLAGRMIGLATSHFAGRAGLAIALPTLERVTAALTQHGRIRRGFLGLSSQAVALPDGLRTKLALTQQSALLVLGVEPGGPAEQAGIMVGDLLLALGGESIATTDDLRTWLSHSSIGQTTTARMARGGELRDLPVTIGERV